MNIMKRRIRYIMYIISFLLTAALVVNLIPLKTNYDKKLRAYCVDCDINGKIVNLEPMDEAVLTMELERESRLFGKESGICGTVTISSYDKLPYLSSALVVTTASGSRSGMARENEFDSEIYQTSLYMWWEKGNTDIICEMYYSQEFERILLWERYHGIYYLCGQENDSFEELIEYFFVEQ